MVKDRKRERESRTQAPSFRRESAPSLRGQLQVHKGLFPLSVLVCVCI